MHAKNAKKASLFTQQCKQRYKVQKSLRACSAVQTCMSASGSRPHLTPSAWSRRMAVSGSPLRAASAAMPCRRGGDTTSIDAIRASIFLLRMASPRCFSSFLATAEATGVTRIAASGGGERARSDAAQRRSLAAPRARPGVSGPWMTPPKYIGGQDLKKEQYSGLRSRRRVALCSGSGWVVAVRTRVSDVNNYGIKVAAS